MRQASLLPMRLAILLFALLETAAAVEMNPEGQPSQTKVLTGIDALVKEHFASLKGLRIGLLTNHTGVSSDGKSDIDLLRGSGVCQLVALFSPEHGLYGKADEKVASSTDTRTGLPVHSLYGSHQKPTAEMLKGLDALIFDIQDIGTRYYTYIGAMANSMKAAREFNLKFFVLDRPNPIGGVKVEGAIPPQSQCGGLTSIYPIPTRHGMTVGELALLFNQEYGIGCNLTVIRMQGWRRAMHFDETGLRWIHPSPNMKTIVGAILYPGPGMLEASSLSVARGTDIPFEMYGAPYVNADQLAKRMNSKRIPGASFAAVEFTPTAPGHPFKNEVCHGIKINLEDRQALDSTRLVLHLLQALMELHSGEFVARPAFKTLSGDPDLWEQISSAKKTPEEILAAYHQALKPFLELRGKYLLY